MNRGRLGQFPPALKEDAIQTSASRLGRRSIVGLAILTVMCVVIAACSAAVTPSASPAATAAPTQSGATASPATSSAPPAATTAPSATPGGTSAVAACTPADVVATSGPLGGAAGSRGADVTVTASGGASCQLTASPVVALSDPSGKIFLTSHLPVAADGPIVSTAASFTFSFQLQQLVRRHGGDAHRRRVRHGERLGQDRWTEPDDRGPAPVQRPRSAAHPLHHRMDAALDAYS